MLTSENSRQAVCELLQRCTLHEDTPVEEFADAILEIVEADLNEGIIPNIEDVKRLF
jgi:hypothetical protein